MTFEGCWLAAIGLLGVSHPFVARRQGALPWLLLVAQILLGVRALLFGVWGVIEVGMLVESVPHFPRMLLTHLGAAILEIALPVLFAGTMAASLLGRREPKGNGAWSRKLSIAQAVLGAAAMLAGAGVVAFDLSGTVG